MIIILSNIPLTINKCIIFSIFLYFLIYKNSLLNTFFYNNPLVSIIIPVHNNLNYTINCISTIINAESTINYEIIIANDMSTDNTKFLLRNYFFNYFNIHIHNNHKKYNFLQNCNKAVEKSKGKYLLFLNNDTKVHKDWLTYLIKLIESDEKIGMVGSKLINENNELQEAGGIIWNNGIGFNYGRGDDADLPEYNYVKEVDYISGASILIKKTIWEQIGGFDERFSPAYYEDTDLAFQLRKLGYKVMYQPKSIVKHYEGISNGKDISSGIKHYQDINKQKFINKWKSELKYQSAQGNVFIARDRSYNKSRILVVDRFVPNFDKDAGGRCCYMYLNIFQKLGLQVTFLGDDLRKIEPYTTILQQKGIEILYGEKYNTEGLELWFRDNLKYFKYVYLQRPSITEKYIYLIKKYFSGKIFYFAHDLHHIRLAREYNITHDINKYLESKYVKESEMRIFNEVDIIHVVGNYEHKILENLLKNKTIRNIPLFYYDNKYTDIEKNFFLRKDLIFVGGLLHSPNIDGVLWFAKEVYPNIVKKYPDIVWHIVSSEMPDEIRNLTSKNIKIEGFLTDENLHLLYQKCRIALAPLRYGAGVKGKILEAAHNQIPLVTTSIGAEGLDKSIGSFIVEDNPKRMAKKICELYEDFPRLKQMADSGKILINKYYTIDDAMDIIMQDL